MTDTPNRPPLWREIDKAWWSLVDTADPHPLPPESDQAACVIRAIAEWLYKQGSLADVVARADTIKLLYAEADRAERGELLPDHTLPWQ